MAKSFVRQIEAAVRKFEQTELSLDDVFGIGQQGIDESFHDYPEALRELERQGKLRILPDRRFRITDEFGVPPQYVTAPVPSSLAAMLAGHREDAQAQTGAYATLCTIENGVRDLIAQTLGGVRPDWWEFATGRGAKRCRGTRRLDGRRTKTASQLCAV